MTRADLSGGFVLLETEDPNAFGEFACTWSDPMDLSIAPVLEDKGLSLVMKSGEAASAKLTDARR